jgi:hypothetical protein
VQFPVVRRSVAFVALGVCLWLLAPAAAVAKTLVRFIHAVPGVGRAEVSVSDGSASQDLGTIGFGQATKWHSIRSGSFRWTLSGGGRKLASGTSTLGRGAYDIVALEHGSGVRLGVYPARAGRSGTALVRVIHAAPELGSPELTVDGKVAVKSLHYTQATPYVALSAGRHVLGADRPGSSTPLISAHATLRVDTSYSEIVLGTRGQRVRVVTLVDRGAPLVRGAHATPVAAHRSRASASGAHASSLVVKPGDSLWTIARSLVGPGASDAAIERKLVSIWDANEGRIGTGDPNLIFPGTRLHV